VQPREQETPRRRHAFAHLVVARIYDRLRQRDDDGVKERIAASLFGATGVNPAAQIQLNARRPWCLRASRPPLVARVAQKAPPTSITIPGASHQHDGRQGKRSGPPLDACRKHQIPRATETSGEEHRHSSTAAILG